MNAGRTRPLFLVLVSPLIAVAAALAIAGILIAMAGAPVLEAYWRIVTGAFGTRLAATETFTRATPLILTGLAAAVAFRARLWNIGAEGQFYVGAIAVAALGSSTLAALPGPAPHPYPVCRWGLGRNAAYAAAFVAASALLRR